LPNKAPYEIKIATEAFNAHINVGKEIAYKLFQTPKNNL